jgi:WD40 repeat protein
MRGEGELRDLPPWWHVYPESVLAVRRADGGETHLACCRCGNVGTPESLGWMGDTCGPCFDRRAEGGTTAGGFGLVGGWAGGYGHVCFSANSQRLVGPAWPSKVRCLDRTTGTEVRIKGLQNASFPAAGTEAGFLFGYVDGRVVRWDGARPKPVSVLESPGTYGRPLIDPRGRWAALVTGNLLFIADLTAESPRYGQVPLERQYVVLRFDPRRERVLAVAHDGSLVALDPATRAQTMLRENIFAGLAPYPYPSDMSVSPDGSAVVVVRHFYNQQSNVVRVVPLRDDQPMFDLPVPRHHRPVAVAFAPDGKHLATFDPNEGWVGFWRLPAVKSLGFARARLESPGSRYAQVGQLCFSPDGATLAVLYSDINQTRGASLALWPWPAILTAAGST